LDWYDYGYRNYDPQIGRFPQLDPLTDNYPELTNYQYASNDPILNIDLDGLEGVPTPGGLWNGSFLEQGVKFAGSGSPALLRTVVTQTVKLTANVAEHKAEDALIKKALEGGVEKGSGAFLKSVGLTIYFTFKPVETGKELTPREMYEKFWYKFKPKEPEENDDREHEQYVLRANRTGYYPIMKWGYKDPVGTVKLKRGDVWKYGTTVNPDSRYSQIWLRKMNLRKFPEETGSAPYVLAQEGIKIIKYFIEYGKLPPGNKMFK